ncbi:hypothetical protein BKK56_09025, partial [Rodentibacter genomosp. 2]|uniref:transferrin-binding protein-like solute binding protein n=1 Tax=Rodentibacter genomosp. 2 TaxID=1908266 RepID=UPI000985DE56
QPTQPSQPNVESSQPTQPNQPNVESSQPTQPSQPNVESSQPEVVNPEATPPATEPQTGEKNDQNANATEPQPSNPEQPSTPTVEPTYSIDEQTAGFLIPKAGGNVKQLFVRESGNNFNVINVEGKSITLIPPGFFGGISSIKDATKFRYSGGGENILWGLIADEDLQNQYLLAYGVNPTSNMPTSGSATYEGNGAHTYSITGDGTIDTFVPTKAKLTANFSDKTLSGNLTTESNKVIDISANINGNKFYGTSSAGTETAGGFYGNNASELAGSYINTKESYLGVYGAKKQ